MSRPLPNERTPSRRSNPFATCWTRPGALPFHFTEGQSARQMIAQLDASRWFGQIIGPHGSGKSSLLAALVPEIVAAGRQAIRLSARAGNVFAAAPPATGSASHFDRPMSASPIQSPSQAFPAMSGLILVVIDGFEQLGWWRQRQWKATCRRRRAGLLVTSHNSCGLPTLVRLEPDRRLVERLVGDLCTQVSTGVTEADVAASFSRHGANVREILFDLYDRHERWSQSDRTGSPTDA